MLSFISVFLIIAALLYFYENTYSDIKCKSICEQSTKKDCYSFFDTCKENGIYVSFPYNLSECREFLQRNRDKYPCTFSIAQTMEGFQGIPCSYTCD